MPESIRTPAEPHCFPQLAADILPEQSSPKCAKVSVFACLGR